MFLHTFLLCRWRPIPIPKSIPKPGLKKAKSKPTILAKDAPPHVEKVLQIMQIPGITDRRPLCLGDMDDCDDPLLVILGSQSMPELTLLAGGEYVEVEIE